MSRFTLSNSMLLLLPLSVASQTTVVNDDCANDINVKIMQADGDFVVIWLVDHAVERLLFEGMLKSMNRIGLV